MKPRSTFLLASLVCGALGACAHRAPERAPPALPPAYTNSLPGPALDAATWATLGDPGLADWIARVLEANTEVAGALARLDAAAAELRAVRAERLPEVKLDASVERRRLSRFDEGILDGESGPGNPATRYATGLTFGYEVDLRGRLRAAARTGAALQAASAHDLAALRLSLARETANLWIERAELQAATALAEQAAQLQREWLAAEQARRAAGLSSAVATREQDAESEQAGLLARRNRAALQRAERGLCLLAGSADAACALPPARPLEQLRVPDTGNAVPAALLQRRPDLAAAQARYEAARARIDEAEAARWPALTLGGVIGVNAGSWSGMRRSGASTWSLLPQLDLPLFDGGRRHAAVERAGADAAEQYAAWQGGIVRAVHEVEDVSAALLQSRRDDEAYARLRTLADQELDSMRRARTAGRVGGLAQWRAQLRQWQATQDSLAARRALLQAGIDLGAALGGGWQHETTRMEAQP